VQLSRAPVHGDNRTPGSQLTTPTGCKASTGATSGNADTGVNTMPTETNRDRQHQKRPSKISSGGSGLSDDLNPEDGQARLCKIG
jgi:hypothetical protein